MSIRKAATQPPRTPPTPKASPKPIADVLGKERQGKAPTDHEISQFLDTYLGLDALERRHALVDLQKAAGEGKGEPAKTLRPWRAATPQACVKLLTGENLPKARRTTEARLEKTEAELAALSAACEELESRPNLSRSEQQELAALKAEHGVLEGECGALRELCDSLARVPRRRPFQDTGFSVEVSAKANLFVGSASAGGGLFIDQRDLSAGKRHMEPMATAGVNAKVVGLRGVLGTEHHGLVREMGAGVSVAKGDPYLPGKVELDVGIASVLEAEGGRIGASAEVPLPFAPALYPLGSMNVRVTVKDPRFDPVSRVVGEKIEIGQEKLGHAIAPVKAAVVEGAHAVKQAVEHGAEVVKGAAVKVADALRDDGKSDDPAGWMPGF